MCIRKKRQLPEICATNRKKIHIEQLTSWTYLKYNSYMTIIESLYSCALKISHTNTTWKKNIRGEKLAMDIWGSLYVLEKVGQSYNVFIDNASSSSSNINQWEEKKHSLVWQAWNPNHWGEKALETLVLCWEAQRISNKFSDMKYEVKAEIFTNMFYGGQRKWDKIKSQ